MTITPEDLVRREVCCCASGLIATLAAGPGAIETRTCSVADLFDLLEQAQDLAAPIDDWAFVLEEAAA